MWIRFKRNSTKSTENGQEFPVIKFDAVFTQSTRNCPELRSDDAKTQTSDVKAYTWKRKKMKRRAKKRNKRKTERKEKKKRKKTKKMKKKNERMRMKEKKKKKKKKERRRRKKKILTLPTTHGA